MGLDVWKAPYYLDDGTKNKHTWAFYFFCKRKGDDITARVEDGMIILEKKT